MLFFFVFFIFLDVGYCYDCFIMVSENEVGYVEVGCYVNVEFFVIDEECWVIVIFD